MTLSFHACPPPGQWFNDPCGLVRDKGGWTLFVQHRADAPAFRRVGWGRLTSRNLLDWRWEGVAIPPDPDASIFSGCVIRTDQDWQAFHTSHADATGLQGQVRRRSLDGRTFGQAEPLILPQPDRRDPFVIDRPDGRLMLLAEPPGWTPAPGARAHLTIWREDEAGRWDQTGVIGPWAPAGVLWEMPVVVRRGGGDLLLVSEVDRFDNSSRCRVRVWRGSLSATGFTLAPGAAPSGELLDLGPEYYAAIPGAGHLVGWLSSWAVARRMPWPGFSGGPISLPRRIAWRDGAVRMAPPRAIERLFPNRTTGVPAAGLGLAQIDGRSAWRLSIKGAGAEAVVELDPATGRIEIERSGPDWLAAQLTHGKACTSIEKRTLRLFIDGPVLELFLEPEGRVLSMILPVGEGLFEITLKGQTDEGFVWRTRA